MNPAVQWRIQDFGKGGGRCTVHPLYLPESAILHCMAILDFITSNSKLQVLSTLKQVILSLAIGLTQDLMLKLGRARIRDNFMEYVTPINVHTPTCLQRFIAAQRPQTQCPVMWCFSLLMITDLNVEFDKLVVARSARFWT